MLSTFLAKLTSCTRQERLSANILINRSIPVKAKNTAILIYFVKKAKMYTKVLWYLSYEYLGILYREADMQFSAHECAGRLSVFISDIYKERSGAFVHEEYGQRPLFTASTRTSAVKDVALLRSMIGKGKKNQSLPARIKFPSQYRTILVEKWQLCPFHDLLIRSG